MTNLPRSLFLVLWLAAAPGAAIFAQLDTIHWIPPMHARDEWGPQYLYLSTPETNPFPVNIRDGAGNLIQSVSISNAKPYRYDLGNSGNTLTLVPEYMLHQPLQGKGLVIDGPKKFYAYFRAHSNSRNHAGDLTCKGRAALGTTFRIGHLLQEVDGQGRRANFVGVMATEDSTVVTLSEVAPGTDYRVGGIDVPAVGPAVVQLKKGESVVFAQYINTDAQAQPPDGFMGALLKATKPVAVNCGSWIGAPVIFMAHDIGIDQITPVEHIGKEYILCMGNGSSVLEHPIVIAHTDNTKVWLNGNPVASISLNAGQYYVVPTSAYSIYGNMYIRTSEPVFLYQMIGGAPTGDDALRTAGLIFVPPISCAIPNAVDNIFEPNRIGDMLFEGGLMIVAMKDSLVLVKIDGVPVNIGAPGPVPGYPEFVTYRNLSLFTPFQTPMTLSVVAKGAVQVGMYGRNQPASFAAFFSGFSKTVEPKLTLSVVGDGLCPDTLVATGKFDGVQWMYGDSVVQLGPDTTLVAFAPGQYIATGYLGVCRHTDFAADTVNVGFSAPAFSFISEPPSCYGYLDGSIEFNATPVGGIPPYQFSIDRGKHYVGQNHFENLGAGLYHLVVRDAAGCYSAPFAVNLVEPDSFYVNLVPFRLPEPLKPGDQVMLQGVPNRSVIATTWDPDRSDGCPNCLLYTFRPDSSTWVAITVFDEQGCRAVDSLLVLVDPRIYAPNAIKLESNAGNDRFTLFSPADLPLRRLLIFDRWGEQLFEKRDCLTNHPEDGWNGVFRGKRVLPGVYVFLAEIEMSPGRVELWKGSVTVF